MTTTWRGIGGVALLGVASLVSMASVVTVGQAIETPDTQQGAPVDRNVYLEQRVLVDPGIDRSFLAEAAQSGDGLHGIVSLQRRPQAGDLGVIRRLGIEPLGFLNGLTAPGAAYVARLGPDLQLDDAAFDQMIRGVQPLLPQDKQALELPSVDDEVLVAFFSDVDAETARGVLADAGVTAQPLAPTLWQGTADPAAVRTLAEADEVQMIDVVTPGLELADEARDLSNVDPVQQLDTTTGVYAGLSGNGVQVGIMDSGVDDDHNDFSGRIVKALDNTGKSDHGSHVAGIAAGSGVQSAGVDDGGSSNGGTPFQWRGVAPRAGIAAYGFIAGNPAQFGDAINNFGADVSNHSYVKNGSLGVYNTNAATIDAIIRGDSPGVPARPAVWAAANNGSVSPRDCDGDGNTDGNFPQYPFPSVPPGGACPTAFQAGYFSILTPCKNCVSVANLTDARVHAGGSGMGPTLDGRLKPDVAASGTGVRSVGADGNSQGDPATGNGYRSKSGTSMAAPVVTGVAALMLEAYADEFGVNLDTAPPLPSTSKAIMVQTAEDLVGVDTTANFDTGLSVQYGAGPDWATGYGLVDAEAAVTMVQERTFLEDSVSVGQTTDDWDVSVVPGQQELRVTLAWDDIAGTPNASDAVPQLVNDLDLVLFGPNGEVVRPLVLPTLAPRDCDNNAGNGVQASTCIGSDGIQNYAGPAAPGVDRLNNVEQVVLDDPAPGSWTARVTALNGDGVTEQLPLGGSQPYSLAGVTSDRSDLSVEKTDAPDPVAAGDDLVYTVTVTNHGPDDALDVTVVDTLPAGTSFDGSTGSCLQVTADTVRCDLGTIAANSSASVDITAAVDADLVFEAGGPTSISNEVTVSSTTPDNDLGNNSDDESTDVVAVADLLILDTQVLDPPAELLVGETVDVTVRKILGSNGPSSPIDAVLSFEVEAPGATIEPADGAIDVPALEAGEQRVVDEEFTIGCTEASSHTFTVENTLSPANAVDTDPDLSNNVAAVSFEVVCVVPVQINIKPHSFPNSVNLNARVPVSVLTTGEGEYGLPLAFDATSIDPLSVRFGPADVVDSGGGSEEVHGQGHVEDSYELDEMTQDGDDDMVLHFDASDAGIQPGDTEACVKGAWVDEQGGEHAFFGCDSIRTVPPGL